MGLVGRFARLSLHLVDRFVRLSLHRIDDRRLRFLSGHLVENAAKPTVLFPHLAHRTIFKLLDLSLESCFHLLFLQHRDTMLAVVRWHLVIHPREKPVVVIPRRPDLVAETPAKIRRAPPCNVGVGELILGTSSRIELLHREIPRQTGVRSGLEDDGLGWNTSMLFLAGVPSDDRLCPGQPVVTGDAGPGFPGLRSGAVLELFHPRPRRPWWLSSGVVVDGIVVWKTSRTI